MFLFSAEDINIDITLTSNFLKNRLKRNFFNRDTLTVAQELLGKILVFNDFQGVITETEAYMGFEDPASHAFRGKTKRTELMFGNAGFSYVYLIYGMYHCLNFVTEKADFPAAVLIRGIHLNIPISGVEGNKKIILDGPGKICRHLGITREHNGIDVITSKNLYICSGQSEEEIQYLTTPRIGIRVGQDKLWRYILKYNV
jgi:DNA-3-methyladenine glycosylase